jgi:hypothetical protein
MIVKIFILILANLIFKFSGIGKKRYNTWPGNSNIDSHLGVPGQYQTTGSISDNSIMYGTPFGTLFKTGEIIRVGNVNFRVYQGAGGLSKYYFDNHEWRQIMTGNF